jgi:hypothetical protein
MSRRLVERSVALWRHGGEGATVYYSGAGIHESACPLKGGAMKIIIQKPKRQKKTCKKGHIYYTSVSGVVSVNICPICWEETELGNKGGRKVL